MGPDIGEPKNSVEIERERQAGLLSNDIRATHKSAIDCLKRMRAIKEVKSAGVTNYVVTEKMRTIDFSSLPPHPAFRLQSSWSGERRHVSIGFIGTGLDQRLQINWGAQNEQSIELQAQGRWDETHQRYSPYYAIGGRGLNNAGLQVAYVEFRGEYGNQPNQLHDHSGILHDSINNYAGQGGYLGGLRKAFNTMAKKYPHPNPIARILGR